MENLPISCSLGSAELQERRDIVLHALRRQVLEVKELENGYALQFAEGEEILLSVFQLIALERACCRFLQFDLKVMQDQGPIWLSLSGPAGTKSFLQTLELFEMPGS